MNSVIRCLKSTFLCCFGHTKQVDHEWQKKNHLQLDENERSARELRDARETLSQCVEPGVFVLRGQVPTIPETPMMIRRSAPVNNLSTLQFPTHSMDDYEQVN